MAGNTNTFESVRDFDTEPVYLVGRLDHLDASIEQLWKSVHELSDKLSTISRPSPCEPGEISSLDCGSPESSAVSNRVAEANSNIVRIQRYLAEMRANLDL